MKTGNTILKISSTDESIDDINLPVLILRNLIEKLCTTKGPGQLIRLKN